LPCSAALPQKKLILRQHQCGVINLIYPLSEVVFTEQYVCWALSNDDGNSAPGSGILPVYHLKKKFIKTAHHYARKGALPY